MNREAKRTWIAIGRRFGASPEARERMAKADAEATDWQGTCKYCGCVFRGSAATLRTMMSAHTCQRPATDA